MRLAIFSESYGDDEAIRILVDAVLGFKTERPPMPRLEARNGKDHVFAMLPSVIKQLHFGSHVDALVVVVDSDETPVHDARHQGVEPENPKCRLCRLRMISRETIATLKPIPYKTPLKLAFGLAVPAIEGWLLCGQDKHITEAAWARGLTDREFPFTKMGLKQKLHGAQFSGRGARREPILHAATRIAGQLDLLERLFPGGFSALANDVRGWK